MKLYATVQSERGKVVTKSGNAYLTVTLYEDREVLCNLFASAIYSDKNEFLGVSVSIDKHQAFFYQLKDYKKKVFNTFQKID